MQKMIYEEAYGTSWLEVRKLQMTQVLVGFCFVLFLVKGERRVLRCAKKDFHRRVRVNPGAAGGGRSSTLGLASLFT